MHFNPAVTQGRVVLILIAIILALLLALVFVFKARLLRWYQKVRHPLRQRETYRLFRKYYYESRRREMALVGVIVEQKLSAVATVRYDPKLSREAQAVLVFGVSAPASYAHVVASSANVNDALEEMFREGVLTCTFRAEFVKGEEYSESGHRSSS